MQISIDFTENWVPTFEQVDRKGIEETRFAIVRRSSAIISKLDPSSERHIRFARFKTLSLFPLAFSPSQHELRQLAILRVHEHLQLEAQQLGVEVEESEDEREHAIVGMIDVEDRQAGVKRGKKWGSEKREPRDEKTRARTSRISKTAGVHTVRGLDMN